MEPISSALKVPSSIGEPLGAWALRMAFWTISWGRKAPSQSPGAVGYFQIRVHPECKVLLCKVKVYWSLSAYLLYKDGRAVRRLDDSSVASQGCKSATMLFETVMTRYGDKKATEGAISSLCHMREATIMASGFHHCGHAMASKRASVHACLSH